MKKVLGIVLVLGVILSVNASAAFNLFKKKDGGKEITINFPSIWVGKDSKARVMAKMIEEFNAENAGAIKVVVEEIADYDSYTEKMRTNIATGNVPDVFIVKHGAQSKLYYKSGRLMDMTPYMNDGWKNDFIESAIQEVSYKDKVMAVPYEFAVTPVWYNMEMFKSIGLDKFPATYDEFFAACEKLQAKGIAPTSQMTAKNAWTSMLWYSQIVISVGGPDVYSRGLSDPAFKEAAKIMKKMFDYTTKDAVGADAAVSAGHFLNERTAVFMNGPWFIGRAKKEGDIYDKIGIAPAPYFEGGNGKPGSYVGFIQAEIMAGKQKDKEKEAAVVEFLKYITNPAKVKELSADSGAMFVVKFDAGNQVERLQGAMSDQAGKAPYMVSHFNSMVAPSVASEFPQALSALILDEIDEEEFVQQLIDAE